VIDRLSFYRGDSSKTVEIETREFRVSSETVMLNPLLWFFYQILNKVN